MGSLVTILEIITMKYFLVAVSVIALSSTVALAEDTNNPKGAGGAAVKETQQEVKEPPFSTNWGQWKKAEGFSGKEQGAAIKDINAGSNQPAP
jgi:hypothetical protein